MRLVPADPLLDAITAVCRKAREDAERKQVHIAAQLDVDQSTVARWEKALGWPRSPQTPGVVVQAYADELGLDPIDLWEQALKLWRASRSEREVVPPLPDALHQPAPGASPNGQADAKRRNRPAKKRRAS